jgi:hypothetical protein
MGVALEVGKLAAVAWIGRHHGTGLRLALGVLVVVLMGLNSIGSYGFLARTHIAHAVAGEVTALARGADVDARLSLQAGIVADIDRRIAQIDGAVEKTTAKDCRQEPRQAHERLGRLQDPHQDHECRLAGGCRAVMHPRGTVLNFPSRRRPVSKQPNSVANLCTKQSGGPEEPPLLYSDSLKSR